jgi:Na+/melibiose symporter-like transporter
MLYSTRTLFQKVDQAIGAALAGGVLTLINFPEKAKPGEVDLSMVQQIAIWDGLLATIPGVIAIYFYSRCRTTRGSYETTRAALALRATAEPGET